VTRDFAPPVVAWHGGRDDGTTLVVLLHGRGSNETDIVALADHLPSGPTYVAVRAPIAEGGGFAWFANRGIGRPVAESLSETMAWFRGWLDEVAPEGRPVLLVGFSGGAAFAGGLILRTRPVTPAPPSCRALSPSRPGSPPLPVDLRAFPCLSPRAIPMLSFLGICSIGPGST
jgi:phospholipase/carboxylesterase